jgi:ATP adenylyltransferase
MTWQEHHERMAFMADVIDRAAENPEAALNFNGNLPDVERLFGSEEGLLLSLQQRWLTALTARLDDDIPAVQARAELAARDPGLRALLDAAAGRSVRVRGLQRDEQDIVEAFGEQTVA